MVTLRDQSLHLMFMLWVWPVAVSDAVVTGPGDAVRLTTAAAADWVASRDQGDVAARRCHDSGGGLMPGTPYVRVAWLLLAAEGE
jgi:hypothetical protein